MPSPSPTTGTPSEKPDVIGVNVSNCESVRLCNKCDKTRPVRQRECECEKPEASVTEKVRELSMQFKAVKASMIDGDKSNRLRSETKDVLNGIVELFPDLATAFLAQEEKIKKMESQLPGGMRDCTIVFEECPVGHGHLRGTNWIKHECQFCKNKKLEADLKRCVEGIDVVMKEGYALDSLFRLPSSPMAVGKPRKKDLHRFWHFTAKHLGTVLSSPSYHD